VTHLIVLLLRYEVQYQQLEQELKEASRSRDAAFAPAHATAPSPSPEVVPTEDRTMETYSGSLEAICGQFFGSAGSFSMEFQLPGSVARDKDKGEWRGVGKGYQTDTSLRMSLPLSSSLGHCRPLSNADIPIGGGSSGEMALVLSGNCRANSASSTTPLNRLNIGSGSEAHGDYEESQAIDMPITVPAE
jgi:hypothetical protein